MNNTTSLDSISLRTLGQQLTSHVCWIIFSFLGIISNLLILVTILWTKSLHNKSQFIIVGHSVGEIFNMCSYFGTGLNRFLLYELSIPETTNQLICCLKLFPLSLGTASVRWLALILAFDRFLCVGVPIFYRSCPARWYLSTVVCLVLINAVIKLPLAFGYYDSRKVLPVCVSSTSSEPIYITYQSVEANTLIVATVAIYVLAVALLYRRYKAAKFVGEVQRREWKKQMDFDVFVSIALIGVIYVVTSGTGAFLTATAARLGTAEATTIVSPFVSLCIFLSSISHVFVYLKVNKAFRKSFGKKILRRHVNSVIQMS